MTAREKAQQLVARFPELISEPAEFRGEVTLTLRDPSQIAKICQAARDELGFNFLLDVSSVDHYGEDPRFAVVYELYSLAERCHLRIKTAVSEAQPELPTVTGVWRTADWHEREIYDMMGLRFTGHPDLRRILMWDGYPYFPLRKDFPLSGKPTQLPEVAFTKSSPMEGGPFVTVPGGKDAIAREPRVRTPEVDALEVSNARLERRRDIREAHTPDEQGGKQ
jgi:NADH-quinone oxidoreductase subunit C